MAKNLKEAFEKNRVAAQELDRALRECLALTRARAGTVVEGRFRLVEGGRSRPRRQV
ncbi:MAG: hypothetical protein ACU0C9_13305 [Paracoccaceae bacterium]